MKFGCKDIVIIKSEFFLLKRINSFEDLDPFNTWYTDRVEKTDDYEFTIFVENP